MAYSSQMMPEGRKRDGCLCAREDQDDQYKRKKAEQVVGMVLPDRTHQEVQLCEYLTQNCAPNRETNRLLYQYGEEIKQRSTSMRIFALVMLLKSQPACNATQVFS